VDAFPAFIPLAGRIVVIAGTGPAADAKARLFDGSPAEIRRVEGEAALKPEAYAGAALAFIATDDEAFARRAAEAARAARALVNVVDRAALSDFTTPAVIDRGEVVAAIGTGGASPMLATLLRHDIEVRVPEGAGRVAALFRRLQDEVREALPDLAARRAFLRAALTGRAAEAAMTGDMAGAETALRESLVDWRMPKGRVQVIDARGPADLVTLRAARALAAADVLVIDAEADPEIVSLARRDAERLATADLATLRNLAGQGLRVARLVAHGGWRAEVEALIEADVDAEVLPISG
jgi:precorrin-2 dehydrogenase/sirohydrochlorin ferrochelatase